MSDLWARIWHCVRCLWHFVWHDDSIASWIVNVGLAFLLIKFVMYPVVGLALGTSLPVVAVVSGSMEHEGLSTDVWWSSCCGPCKGRQPALYAPFDISLEDIKAYPFSGGFNKGDLMILTGPESVRKGDILVFRADRLPDPIIHRVVDDSGSFTTKGDNNCAVGEIDKSITQDRVLGKAAVRVPLLGWVKVAATCGIQAFQGRSFTQCMRP